MQSVQHNRSDHFLIDGIFTSDRSSFFSLHGNDGTQNDQIDGHDHDAGHHQIKTGAQRRQTRCVPILLQLRFGKYIVRQILIELYQPTDKGDYLWDCWNVENRKYMSAFGTFSLWWSVEQTHPMNCCWRTIEPSFHVFSLPTLISAPMQWQRPHSRTIQIRCRWMRPAITTSSWNLGRRSCAFARPHHPGEGRNRDPILVCPKRGQSWLCR